MISVDALAAGRYAFQELLRSQAGQASVVFIFAMQALRDAHGAFTFSLSVFIVLMVMSSLGVLALEESRMVTKAAPAEQTVENR